jgi:ABC-2 type transport system permease protein
MESIFFLAWISHGIFGEYIEVLYYVLFNLAAAAIVIVLISLIYRPVNTWLNSNNGHTDYDKLKKKNKDTNQKLDHILLKKEWNMVLRKPQYLLNSILGEIFYLIMAIVFILMPTLFLNGASETPESLPYVFALLVPAMGIFMNSIATTTSSSISFEGKYGYEMLRCYPMENNAIIKAKLKVGIYLQAIMNLFVSLIIMVFLIIKGFYQPYHIIPVFLYPQLAGITLAIVGMLTGLRWPKLDYENESQVLKNSAASNFLLLFVMLPSTVIFGIHVPLGIFGLEYEFLHYVSLGTIVFLYAIIIIITLSILKKKGSFLFDRIISRY